MNTPGLSKKLATETKVPVRTASSIIKTIRGAMTEALVNGENIEIRGFATFKIRNRSPYMFTNPITGEKSEIKPRKSVLFTVGDKLKKAVDDGGKNE
jgi:integration host factor subunit beta